MAELSSALSTAGPGTTIILNNGNYALGGDMVLNGKNGTVNNPITIRAANPALVNGVAQANTAIFTTGRFKVASSSYVVVRDLKFTTETNTSGSVNGLFLLQSNNISVINNHFRMLGDASSSASAKCLLIQGQNSNYNLVDNNLFEDKAQRGQYILIEKLSGEENTCRYNVIRNNIFKNRAFLGDDSNGGEAVVLGAGGGFYPSYSILENNLFDNCDGDSEVVSIKSNFTTVRFNVFLGCSGAVVARQADSATIHNNIFLGQGDIRSYAIRLYGEDHKIYNNYIEGMLNDDRNAQTSSPSAAFSSILVANGKADDLPAGSQDTNSYARIKRAIIVHNTLVNNTWNLTLGNGNALPSQDVLVANNIIVGSQNSMIKYYGSYQPVNPTFSKNILWATGGASATSGVTLNSSQALEADPVLVSVPFTAKKTDGVTVLWSGNVYKLSGSSTPAINAGATGPFTTGANSLNVTNDMDNNTRSTPPDIGADELN